MLLTRSQRLPEATLLSVKRIYLRPRRAGFYFLPLGALLTGSVKTKRSQEQVPFGLSPVSGREGHLLLFSCCQSCCVVGCGFVFVFSCRSVLQEKQIAAYPSRFPPFYSFIIYIWRLLLYLRFPLLFLQTLPPSPSCKASWFLVLSRRTSHCLKQIITGKVRGSLKGHFFGYSSECLH